jgi:hypothetical protein
VNHLKVPFPLCRRHRCAVTGCGGNRLIRHAAPRAVDFCTFKAMALGLLLFLPQFRLCNWAQMRPRIELYPQLHVAVRQLHVAHDAAGVHHGLHFGRHQRWPSGWRLASTITIMPLTIPLMLVLAKAVDELVPRLNA